MVTTDHSPCPAMLKRRDEGRWDVAWGGIASLGLALPVVWTALAKRDKDIAASATRIGKWMAGEPARLAGMSGRKGALVAGCDADFVVFDPDATWKVSEQDLHFRHKISPYLGLTLRGRVLETWLRGKPVFRRGEFLGEASGRELVRA